MMLQSWKLLIEVRDQRVLSEVLRALGVDLDTVLVSDGTDAAAQHQLLVVGELVVEAQRIDVAEFVDREIAQNGSATERTTPAADRTARERWERRILPPIPMNLVSGLTPVMATGPLVPTSEA